MKQWNNVTILAIETSCDDTCVAIVEADKRGLTRGFTRTKFNILSNVISSQIKIHQKYGGVYPTLAKREHQKNLAPVLFQSLKGAKLLKKEKSFDVNLSKTKKLEKILEREKNLFKRLRAFFKQYKKPKIDLIAVTIGPGLEPCLWVGINFARALAFSWKLPIIPVNHIEAHIFANFVGGNSKFQMQPYGEALTSFDPANYKTLSPAICLVVSGGHTQLILMKNFGCHPPTTRGAREVGGRRGGGVPRSGPLYKILGETRDDAAGECFDKTARILEMGYPGGPAIAAEAAKFKVKGLKSKVDLPRPMIYQKNFDFSFSGLKTAVLYNFKKQPQKVKTSKRYIQEMSAEIQQAIIDVLIKKTIEAARKYKAKTIILGGGVVANTQLRKQFKEKIKKEIPTTKYLIPDTKFCTDNALMVAVTAYFLWSEGKRKKWEDIKAEANLRIGSILC